MNQRMKAEDITENESNMRWETHERLHNVTERGFDKDLNHITERIDANLEAHERVHEIHAAAHEREHSMTNLALEKAEQSMDHRLDSMNEFREQLNKQTATFLSRESYEKAHQELIDKIDLALSTLTEKDNVVTQSLVNRHDSDFNSLRDLIGAEREIRKAFEGSINTWKWLAGFLGASGVAGVIFLFATRTT